MYDAETYRTYCATIILLLEAISSLCHLPQPLTYPGIILSDCISKMSSLDELIKKLGESVRGNVDPEELGFEDDTVTIDRMPNLSVRELQAEHYRCSQIQAATKQLGLGRLEKTNALCLSYFTTKRCKTVRCPQLTWQKHLCHS